MEEVGRHLVDVDLIIHLRSGQTELSQLQKLMKAIVASSTSLTGDELVLIESEMNVKTTSSGRLTNLIYRLSS